MPVYVCPAAQCNYVTGDMADAVAVVMLQIHIGDAHQAAQASTACPRALRMDCPRIDSTMEPVAWNNFLRRWEIFHVGSGTDDTAALI